MTKKCHHDDDLLDVAFGLDALIKVQAEGANNLPEHLKPYDQADFRTAALGAFVELGELVNECQWKPWRHYDSPTVVERQKVLKELADVLHFLPWMIRNLKERFGIETYEVAASFIEVHQENIQRFRGNVPGREPPPANSGWRQLPLRAEGG